MAARSHFRDRESALLRKFTISPDDAGITGGCRLVIPPPRLDMTPAKRGMHVPALPLSLCRTPRRTVAASSRMLSSGEPLPDLSTLSQSHDALPNHHSTSRIASKPRPVITAKTPG